MGFLGIKGPKELLASSISSALNEYFEVDERAIEANLLKDARIVLRNVKLRPQNCIVHHSDNKKLIIQSTGGVEEVSFKWTWVIRGNDDEAAWMKDVSLIISGLELNIALETQTSKTSKNSCTEKEIQEQPITSYHKKQTKVEENVSRDEGKVQAYIRNQIEYIIDALTLIVSEFKVTLLVINDPNPSIKQLQDAFSCGIVVGGKQLQLKSLGRLGSSHIDNEKRALSQHLIVESFYIETIIQQDNEHNKMNFPLLMPIAYEAMATVQSGKRFGSLGRGLIFEGLHSPCEKEGLCSRSDIIFNLGFEQLKALSVLTDLMLTYNVKGTSGESHTDTYEIHEDTEVFSEDKFEGLKQDLLKCSIFTIPIASISVILPNDLQIRLLRFTINYSTDGKIFNIESSEGAGININDYHLLSFHCDEKLGVKSFWHLDLISRCFSIKNQGNDKSHSTEVVSIRFCSQAFKKVLEGVNMLSEPVSNMFVGASTNLSNGGKKSWLVDIDQRLSIRLENEKANGAIDWLHAHIDSVNASIPFTTSFSFHCKGLTIGPSSHGKLLVGCPNIYLHPGSNVICADGVMSLHADSTTTLKGVIDLLSSFNHIVSTPNKLTQNKPKSQPSKVCAVDGFILKAPSFDFCCFEDNLLVKVDGIEITNNYLQCNSVAIQHDNVCSATLKHIVFQLNPVKTVSIEIVESLELPGIASLLEPIMRIHIEYKNHVSTIHFSKVALLLSNEDETQVHVDTKENEENKGEITALPIEVEIQFDKLKFYRDDENERKTLSTLNRFAIVLHKSDGNRDVIPMNLVLNQAKSHLFELDNVNLSAEIMQSGQHEIKNFRLEKGAGIKVYAGHSFSDWTFTFFKLFQRRERFATKSKSPMNFPHIFIPSLDINVSYKFSKLSNTDTIIHTSAFSGSADTTSADLISFYKMQLFPQIPGLLKDTDILGMNIVGTSLLIGGYTFGAVGTVAGVFGLDAIKNNLKAGKESRGAGKGDKYEVGDFLRGIEHSISKATKSGVKIRSGGNDTEEARKGNIIDYTVGASSELKKYVGNNQAKLVGAGTATAAMTVGTVFLGPVGVVAGAAVGALAEKVAQKRKERQESTVDTLTAQHKAEQNLQAQTREDSFILVPQGILFKRRDIFTTEWLPRWFILDVSSKTLNYHIITQNSPPSLDTNILNILSKPATANTDSQEDIDFKLEPKASIQLSKAKITVNDKLSSSKHNLYSFTITVGDIDQCWHLGATSDEVRRIWMTILMDLSDLCAYEDIVNDNARDNVH